MRVFSVMFAVLIALSLTGNAVARSAVFHVATDGNDAWSGTKATHEGTGDAGPFRTLGRARDAVRQLKQDTGLSVAGVVVEIAPGTYTLRLAAGDTVSEQTVTLNTDPRVLESGTTPADIAAQVELELKLINLLSEARMLEKSLADKEEADAITPAELEQLEKLRTAEGIYMQPMLVSQIGYLYNMISNADQAPGEEATERYAVLVSAFEEIKQAAAAAP